MLSKVLTFAEAHIQCRALGQGHVWVQLSQRRWYVIESSGCDETDLTGAATQNYNTNEPVIPLRSDAKLTVDKWFGHGHLGLPPKSGDFMELPAGGTYKGELACNRADSKLRDPRRTDAQPNFACSVSVLISSSVAYS